MTVPLEVSSRTSNRSGARSSSLAWDCRLAAYVKVDESCGQLIVSETLFALLYSFAWDGRWPQPAQLAACVLFTLGILASIKAHR